MAENGPGRFHKIADVVVTNPPFGTKSNEGIDMKFLEAAQERFYHYLCPRDPVRRSASWYDVKLIKANIEFSNIFSA